MYCDNSNWPPETGGISVDEKHEAGSGICLIFLIWLKL
jgi:hypothetical protein